VSSPRQSLPAPRFSAAWHRWFPIQYALIRLADPLVRLVWRGVGLGNVVELQVPGRRTGKPRKVLLGLLRDGEHLFLGHPNGHVDWTRNLQAAGEGELVIRPPTALPIRAHALPAGELRDRAIRATTQHVFPGNVIYRLAWRHIRAAGAFFEIELAE
jgi:deazaflavin-dependent oxidoreductase (nitroreductase family)